MSRRPRCTPWVLCLSVLVVLIAPSVASAQGPFLHPTEFAVNAAWAPDGRLFYVEKDTGEVWVIEDGERAAQPAARVEVRSASEQGLLGIALHPDFELEPWVYLYYSDAVSGLNRVVRFRVDGNDAGSFAPVIDLTPVENGYHNGGDITFGPDGMLYVAVGEAHESARAQNRDDLGGKILRLNPDGSVPADNPFGADNPVYSLGHRNSFGLCFDTTTGQLWETENGPQEWDEVNEIQEGGNYGWPTVSGPRGEGFIDPVLSYEQVIVPTGCVARDGILWFGDFNGNIHRFDGVSEEVIATAGSGVADLQWAPDGQITVVAAEEISSLDVGVSGNGASGNAPTAVGEEMVTVESPVSLAIFLAIILAAIAAVGYVTWQRRDRDRGGT